MISRRRRPVEHLFRSTTCLALAGLAAVAGCGNPGEGTIRVSPEARARLVPHVPVMTKAPKGRIVEQRPIGIKDRGVAHTRIPVKPGIRPR